MSFDRVRHAAIIGPGLTGASLAVLFTGNGIKTTLLALNEKDANSGKARYDAYFQDLIKEKLITADTACACERILRMTCAYRHIADADFIFECVFENMDTKHSVYRSIESSGCRAKAIASATSSQSADVLAEGFADKTRFLVAHPWNPPHLVPCVEVVQSAWTSKAAVSLTMELLEYLGREPILMKKNVPGFIGNRLQHAMFREAVCMVEQGVATPEDIDKTILTSFGPRYSSVGIFEHFDYVGLTTIRDVDNNIFPTLCCAKQAQNTVTEHIAKGDLGFKTGKGMLDWSKKDPDEFRQRAAKPYMKRLSWHFPKE